MAGIRYREAAQATQRSSSQIKASSYSMNSVHKTPAIYEEE